VDYIGKTDCELAEYSPFFREAFLACEQSDELAWERKSLSSGEEVITTPDGVEHILEIIKVPLFHSNGERKGLVVLGRDITERKKAEFELIKAKEEAEKSNKLKSEFLAQMSHEIRSPINIILSFTSLLKEEVKGKLPQEMDICFDSIDSGGKRIIRTIDQILNMSEIQTGSFESTITEIDLIKDILSNCITEFRTPARLKGLELKFKADVESAQIKGDSYSINQIFTNLIDNAIKYTHNGEVEVALSKPDGKSICVDVRDTGIGISEEYLPDLFKPFSQEESGYTRRFEGNGLGLALVKKYVEINNADIIVESTKGRGSMFRVIFRS
jgi:signal transduction histidine kinase